MTLHRSFPLLAGLVACAAMVPLAASADFPLRGVVMAEGVQYRPGAAFFSSPWLWVSVGQPILSSPLFGAFPAAAAALSPGVLRTGLLLDPPAPGVASVMVDDRQALARADQRVEHMSSSAPALNFSSSVILNVGVSNVR